jgi:hypothetical protein
MLNHMSAARLLVLETSVEKFARLSETCETLAWHGALDALAAATKDTVGLSVSTDVSTKVPLVLTKLALSIAKIANGVPDPKVSSTCASELSLLVGDGAVWKDMFNQLVACSDLVNFEAEIATGNANAKVLLKFRQVLAIFMCFYGGLN